MFLNSQFRVTLRGKVFMAWWVLGYTTKSGPSPAMVSLLQWETTRAQLCQSIQLNSHAPQPAPSANNDFEGLRSAVFFSLPLNTLYSMFLHFQASLHSSLYYILHPITSYYFTLPPAWQSLPFQLNRNSYLNEYNFWICTNIFLLSWNLDKMFMRFSSLRKGTHVWPVSDLLSHCEYFN